MEVIRAIRNLRAELKVQAGHKARLMLRPHEGWRETLENAEGYFGRLASVSSLKVLDEDEKTAEKIVSAVVPAAEVLIPLGDLVDIEQEIKRLMKEKDGMEKEIQRAEGKLSNPGFLVKAPEQLVKQEQEKLAQHRLVLGSLEKRIEELKA